MYMCLRVRHTGCDTIAAVDAWMCACVSCGAFHQPSPPSLLHPYPYGHAWCLIHSLRLDDAPRVHDADMRVPGVASRPRPHGSQRKRRGRWYDADDAGTGVSTDDAWVDGHLCSAFTPPPRCGVKVMKSRQTLLPCVVALVKVRWVGCSVHP